MNDPYGSPSMLKSRRIVVGFTSAVIAAWLLFAWFRSRPQIVGRLPRQDMRAIRSLLDHEQGGLGSAVRQTSRDMLADWIFNHRDGQLMRLEVQSFDRVLALLHTTEPSRARLLIVERSAKGWRVSETNNDVTLRN